MAKIILTSERKGSNPGSNCFYEQGNRQFEAYIKYCPGSRLTGNTAFTPQNQPVYEALTGEMARRLGLKLPESFVLLNRPANEFDTRKLERKNVWDEHRKSYFISKKIKCPVIEDLALAEEQMQGQKLFRKILMISDIEGRKQNWFYCPQYGGLNYLDVGCGIIQAHEGVITMKHEALRSLETSHKELKMARKELSHYHLITANDKDILNLGDIANMPYNIEVPTLNPAGKISLTELISEEEIEQIVKILTMNMHREIKNLKEFPRLIKP